MIVWCPEGSFRSLELIDSQAMGVAESIPGMRWTHRLYPHCSHLVRSGIPDGHWLAWVRASFNPARGRNRNSAVS